MQGNQREDIGARHVQIQHLLAENGPTKVKDIAEQLHFSDVTIYRDIKKLEKEGILQLDNGIVVLSRSFTSEIPPSSRYESNLAAKEIICNKASEFIRPDSTIILDDSSTVLPLLDFIKKKAPLTVITNSVFAGEQLMSASGIRLYMTGGLYYPWANAFHGHMAIHALESLQADICFVSTTSVTSRGAADSYDATAELKSAMLSISETKILLADSSKFRKRALYIAGTLSDFDYVITDKKPENIKPDQLAEAHTQLITVGPEINAESSNEANKQPRKVVS